jgi:2-oxoglutarate dehydrogenase E2 component (dihydrolipoamide succinyltransferase)
MMHNIVAPTVGESITEVRIQSWSKKHGDYVRSGEVVAEIESDKATVEVIAEASGQLKIVETSTDMIPIGKLIAQVDDSVAAPAGGPAPTKAPASSASSVAASAASSTATAPTAGAPVMPAAKKIAADNGIDPAQVAGTGKDGRVTKGDVLAQMSGASLRPHSDKPAAAATPITRPGERRVPMSLLRLKIAERLVQAQQTAAILTTFNEVDLTEVNKLRSKYKESFKKKYGVGLGFMSFFTKASLEALKAFPSANAFVEGKDIVYHDYFHIGVAVGTDRGLVVPVVRDADKLSFAGIEQEIVNLATRAKDGKLGIADMSGGTFSISNGGVYGSMMSTPILNPPQSAILGMHNIMQRPIAVDGPDGKKVVEIRPMMYLALSYDHRIIDGKEAVGFLIKIKDCLEKPSELLKLDFVKELG